MSNRGFAASGCGAAARPPQIGCTAVPADRTVDQGGSCGSASHRLNRRDGIHSGSQCALILLKTLVLSAKKSKMRGMLAQLAGAGSGLQEWSVSHLPMDNGHGALQTRKDSLPFFTPKALTLGEHRAPSSRPATAGASFFVTRWAGTVK